MIQLLLLLIYLSFISLGLPDSLLGSAWPVIHEQMNLPVSFAGIITAIICLFTVLASILSAKITKKLGTGVVVVLSVFLTVIALGGFYFSSNFIYFPIF